MRTKRLNCFASEYNFRNGLIVVPFTAHFTFSHLVVVFWLAAAAVDSAEALTVSYSC